MKFKSTSNIDEVLRHMQDRIASLTHTHYQAIVGTNVDYAQAVEYGSKTRWTRISKRSAAKIGTFQLPKGGTSERTIRSTLVKQTPKAMVRLSKPNIKAYARKVLRAIKDPSDTQVLASMHDIANYSWMQIAMRTPVDTSRLRASWKPRVIYV